MLKRRSSNERARLLVEAVDQACASGQFATRLVERLRAAGEEELALAAACGEAGLGAQAAKETDATIRYLLRQLATGYPMFCMEPGRLWAWLRPQLEKNLELGERVASSRTNFRRGLAFGAVALAAVGLYVVAATDGERWLAGLALIAHVTAFGACLWNLVRLGVFDGLQRA